MGQIWSLSVILLLYLQRCQSQRRIVNGQQTTAEKGYMVYLLKVHNTNRQLYNEWLCGGALISRQHILTSAACLEEASNMYAVAGYRKYIHYSQLDLDECTMNRRRKVVKTCTPAKYTFSRSDPKAWMQQDIGIAIVDSPYDFADSTYHVDCDYVPKAIRVNYRPDVGVPGEDAVVFGWGHSNAVREPEDVGDYNAEYMHEASTTIQNTSDCQNAYRNFDDVIQKYMICCDGVGALTGDGEPVFHFASNSQSCPDLFRRADSLECGIIYETRRSQNLTSNYAVKRINPRRRRPQNKRFDTKMNAYHKVKDSKTTSYSIIDSRRSRSPGICQNDHGSPLVTWVGADEVIIGVATTSLLDSSYKCNPPYLYTRTSCFSLFIRCVVGGYDSDGRRACENMEKKEGYKIDETIVPWHAADGGTSSLDSNVTKNIDVPNSTDKDLQSVHENDSTASLLSSTVLSSDKQENITFDDNFHQTKTSTICLSTSNNKTTE